MQTIVELSEYLKSAEKLLPENERNNIVTYLAFNPKAGAIIKGTGGIRKLRWKRGGRGKSGGVRVIYYFHNEHIPLYLLTMFGKGEMTNLSKAERNDLRKLVRILVDYWERRI